MPETPFPVNFAKFLSTHFYRTSLGDCSEILSANKRIVSKEIEISTATAYFGKANGAEQGMIQ